MRRLLAAFPLISLLTSAVNLQAEPSPLPDSPPIAPEPLPSQPTSDEPPTPEPDSVTPLPSPDKEALAEQLIRLMKLEESMVSSLDRVKAMAENQTHTLAERLGVDLSNPEVAEVIHMRVLELVLSEYRWSSLQPAFVKIYADLFSAEELQGLIDFYSSPLGQTLLDKQTELLRRSTEISQRRAAELLPQIELIVMDARINTLKGNPVRPSGPTLSTTP